MLILFKRTLGIAALFLLLCCDDQQTDEKHGGTKTGSSEEDAGRDEDAGAEPSGDDAGPSRKDDTIQTSGAGKADAGKADTSKPDAGKPETAGAGGKPHDQAGAGGSAQNQSAGAGGAQAGAGGMGDPGKAPDAGAADGGNARDPIDIIWDLARRTPQGMASDAIMRFLEALNSSDMPLSAQTIEQFLRSIDEEANCTQFPLPSTECASACQLVARLCPVCVADEACGDELEEVCGVRARLCR